MFDSIVIPPQPTWSARDAMREAVAGTRVQTDAEAEEMADALLAALNRAGFRMVHITMNGGF